AGLRALIVDDNATNRRIFRDTLAAWGMRPELVDSGAAALALLATHDPSEPFELTIVDCNMPAMDGFELIERIRERSAGLVRSIVMLTSGGQPGDAAPCREAGISAYLSKRISTRMLRAG